MRDLYIMVGIPGSGKTKYSKELDGIRCSFREARKRLYGDPDVGGDSFEVYQEFENQIRDALCTDSNVIIDCQGLTIESRKAFVKKYKKHFDRIIAVYMDTAVNVCKLRNHKRKHKVCNHTVDLSYDVLIPPSLAEGFDKIIVVKTQFEGNSQVYEILPNQNDKPREE